MLLTGLSLNAEEAYQAGLVSKVVTPENLGKFFDLFSGKKNKIIAILENHFRRGIKENCRCHSS